MEMRQAILCIICVLSIKGTRGSDLCYNCLGVATPTGCAQIEECQPSQACWLQRVNHGNSVTYNLGCRDQTVCPVEGAMHLIGRSSSSDNTDCSSCCHDDLCIPEDCGTSSVDTTAVTTTVTKTTSGVDAGGTWSDWSPWTPCPYTCGHDGIHHRFRHCAEHTMECEGPKFESKICHVRVCCTGPPVITYIDQDRQMALGGFVSLYCNATNADQILWQIPKIVGKPYPVNVFRPVGLDTVVVANANADNRGAYVCSARNACGEDTRLVMIDVV